MTLKAQVHISCFRSVKGMLFRDNIPVKHGSSSFIYLCNNKILFNGFYHFKSNTKQMGAYGLYINRYEFSNQSVPFGRKFVKENRSVQPSLIQESKSEKIRTTGAEINREVNYGCI